MNMYLPIAEVSVNIYLLLGIGGGVGFLSGLFGVGGGFLITPLLMLIGIPPSVAVATGANQVAAASFSGLLVHWRRKTVDFKMGMVLLAGGLGGSAVGVQLFDLLRRLGQIELFVSLCYVVMLGSIGAMMLVESLRALRRSRLVGGRRAAATTGRMGCRSRCASVHRTCTSRRSRPSWWARWWVCSRR